MRARVDKELQAQLQHILVPESPEKQTPIVIGWNPHPRCSVPESKPLTPVQQQHLSKWGLQCEKQKRQVDPHQLIRTQLLFAEVSKQMQKQLGLHWSQQLQAQLIPHSSTLEASQLEVLLQAKKGKGRGQVLASPSLVARSGYPADFIAGGELPVQVGSYKSRSVQWKTYGIRLKVKAEVDPSQYLRLNVLTEISSIDAGQSQPGLPAFKTKKLETEVDMREPGTLLLSGLLRSQGDLSQELIPGLHSIPILGSLFRSQQFLRDKSELVIFLTPSWVQASDDPPSYPKGWQSE
jgi:Flp pilus assembly secretin CpaC